MNASWRSHRSEPQRSVTTRETAWVIVLFAVGNAPGGTGTGKKSAFPWSRRELALPTAYVMPVAGDPHPVAEISTGFDRDQTG